MDTNVPPPPLPRPYSFALTFGLQLSLKDTINVTITVHLLKRLTSIYFMYGAPFYKSRHTVSTVRLSREDVSFVFSIQ